MSEPRIVAVQRPDRDGSPASTIHGDRHVAQILRMIAAPPPAPPVLVEVNYQGYNLVRYAGRVYALALSLGPVDLASLDLDPQLQACQVIVGDSADVVKSLVDRVALAAERSQQLHAVSTELGVLQSALDEQSGVAREKTALSEMLSQQFTTALSETERLLQEVSEQRRVIGEKSRTADALAQSLEVVLRERRSDASLRDRLHQELGDLSVRLKTTEAELGESQARVAALRQQEGRLEIVLKEATDRETALHSAHVDDARRHSEERLAWDGEAAVMRSWIGILQEMIVSAPPRARRVILTRLR